MMQVQLFQFAKFTFCLLVIAGVVSSEPPDSPCPELFQYKFDGSDWIGLIELNNIKVDQTVINIILELSLPTSLPSLYKGRLDLLEEKQQAVQAVLSNKPLFYRITFPLKNPIPRVTQIAVNNDVLCSGPPDQSPQMTRFQLHHVFYPKKFGHPSISERIPNDGSPCELTDGTSGMCTIVNKYSEIYKGSITYEELEKSRCGFVDGKDSVCCKDPDPPTGSGPQTIDAICGQPVSNVAQLGVNGELAERGDWPWLAAIFVENGPVRDFQCGGTLLTEKITISAAHCFFREGHRVPISAKEIFTAIGCYNVKDFAEPGSLFLATERIEFPPDFYRTDSFEDDIAIIRHIKSVSFTEFPHIRPICMWSGSQNTLEIEGRKGTVVGWGKDNNGNEVTPTPKKIDVGIVSRKTCIRGSSQLEAVTARTNFCAGERNGTGPCTGGSGLAIYNKGRWELRGILAGTVQGSVTKINQLCELDEYVVYVDVIQFSEWLRSFFTF